MDSKRGEDPTENTLYTQKLTFDQLRDFCERHGVFFVNDITLPPFTPWRAASPFESPLAKRNNRGRVKSFFKLRYDAGIILTNPSPAALNHPDQSG